MRRSTWAARAIGAAFVLTLGCSRQGPPEPHEQVVGLVQELPKAKVQAPDAKYVLPLTFAAAGEKRPVLFMHPTSSVTFAARPIRAGMHLRFGIAINELAWDKGGDGVLFTVQATSPGKPAAEVFSRYLNPKAVAGDRRWIDADLPLDQVAGDAVELTFATSPGPAKNNAYDWAGWSGISLVTPS